MKKLFVILIACLILSTAIICKEKAAVRLLEKAYNSETGEVEIQCFYEGHCCLV